MTPEKQRIAIAEFDAWHHIKKLEDGTLHGILGPLRGWLPLPDYLRDLDAMHGAVARLDRESQYDSDEGFTCQLARVVHQDPDKAGWNFYELQEATATQRAEALLRTIRKWEE